ncbi:glycosyltransferase [Carboxylicivirga sp. N1Y90]|uniref:glycosyltransferase n=1 Tax=Carboxylicivirga fragile TaxID=3417571 RepID=UPI003D34139A|nr:glycosyltransferase [Marinilabiliaceae bacterium N1Y90]
MTPLVSVIISAYNSSGFIIETLQSIKEQSYENVELIITDDYSTDDTVEVCEKWIETNGDRFINAIVLKSDVNTGVSANANRGLKQAKGDWVKLLGADDTLKIDCLKDNVHWVVTHPEVKVLLSRIEIYMDTFDKNNLIETTPGIPYSPEGILGESRSAESQYKMLLVSDRIHFTPSIFFNTETVRKVGGFDERFRLLEDYPLWLNLTRAGFKIHFMEKITVNYRRHKKAINNTGINYLINPNYFRSEEFRKIYTYQYLPLDLRCSARLFWLYSQLFRAEKNNKNTVWRKRVFSLLTFYLNPFTYVIWLRKRLIPSVRQSEFYI